MGYDITATATEQRRPQTRRCYEYSRLACGGTAAGKLIGTGSGESFGCGIAGDISYVREWPEKARWIWRDILLSQFGSLRLLLEADLEAFSKQLGLGPAKFAQLQAVKEMGRRHLAERSRGKTGTGKPASGTGVTSKPCCAMSHTRCSGACFLTPKSGAEPSRRCFAAPSTTPAFIPGRWSSAHWPTTPRRDPLPQPSIRVTRGQSGRSS
jgi:hypothetical protein